MATVTPDTDNREAQDQAYDPEHIRARETEAARHAAEAAGDAPLSAGDQAALDQIEEGERQRDLAQRESNSTGISDIPSTYTGKNTKSKLVLKDGAKKHGPLVGLLITILGGGIGIAGLGSPFLMLQHVAETLLGYADNATPALSIRTKFSLALKINSIANGFEFNSDGKCGIRCKFGTMDTKLVKSFEANGWKVTPKEGARIPGRMVVASMTAPDGTIIDTGEKFRQFSKVGHNVLEIQKVINFRSAYYLNKAFKGVTNRLELNKRAKVTGTTEAEVDESVRKSLGLDAAGEGGKPTQSTPETAEEDGQRASEKLGSTRASSLRAKFTAGGSKAGNIAAAVCGLYDIGRAMSLATKAAKISLFVSTAFMILNVADMIKSGDNPDPEVVNRIASKMTDYQNTDTYVDSSGKEVPNAYKGISFTDSKSYRSAQYYDNPGTITSEQETKFTISSAAVGGWIGSILGFLNMKNSFQAVALKAACSIEGQAATTAAQCATEQAAGSAIPGLGNLAALVVCAATNVGGGYLIGAGAGLAIGELFKVVIRNELPDNYDQAIGGELADGSYSGVVNIENSRCLAVGCTAASSSEEATQYKLSVASEVEQMTQIARLEARNEPFNVYNQYSFLGSLVRNLGVPDLAGASVQTNFSSMLSLIPRSFASLIPKTSAASQDAAAYGKLFSTQCFDSALSSIGAACDAYGNPTMIVSDDVMNADIKTTLDYMIDSAKQIDDDGNVIPGSDYEKFVKYCAERTIPIGESELGITGDPLNPDTWDVNMYDWRTGSKCLDKSTQIQMFQTYTMDKVINDTLDDLYSNGTQTSSAEDTDTSTATPSTESTPSTNESPNTLPTTEQSLPTTLEEESRGPSATDEGQTVTPPTQGFRPVNSFQTAFVSPRTSVLAASSYKLGWVVV